MPPTSRTWPRSNGGAERHADSSLAGSALAERGSGGRAPKPRHVRNPTLHAALQEFTADAGARLTQVADGGDHVPFEVVETDASRRGRVPLYCYRALTGDFIRARAGLLVALASYAPAVRALQSAGGTEVYLRARGETVVSDDARQRAEAAMRCFVSRVFDGQSNFELDPERLERAYGELERSLYRGRCVAEVIAPLHGLDLDPDTKELILGEGLLLIRPEALVGAPPELARPRPAASRNGAATAKRPSGDPAAGIDTTAAPALLIVLRTSHESSQPPPVCTARSRFRRVLTALRLFEAGGYSIGPQGYARVDDGAWTQIALGESGRPGLVTRIERGQEDELRAFTNLVARRIPAPFTTAQSSGALPDGSGAGELTWALSRFEMGCERLAPFEALTDYLLGLRALLEPEGPASGRLAQRLAVICAPPEGRAALAERTAQAIGSERALIAGLAAASLGVDDLAEELAEHLRAILRDVICGHLDLDVRGLADELLAEAARARGESPAPFTVA